MKGKTQNHCDFVDWHLVNWSSDSKKDYKSVLAKKDVLRTMTMAMKSNQEPRTRRRQLARFSTQSCNIDGKQQIVEIRRFHHSPIRCPCAAYVRCKTGFGSDSGL